VWSFEQITDVIKIILYFIIRKTWLFVGISFHYFISFLPFIASLRIHYALICFGSVETSLKESSPWYLCYIKLSEPNPRYHSFSSQWIPTYKCETKWKSVTII